MKELLIGIVVITGFVGFIFGAGDATFKTCSHTSIASYHPAYLLGCELFKRRFQ